MKCEFCGGSNTPHPMDQYHYFLLYIKQAQENIRLAKKIADKGLPSIQNKLNHTIDSLEQLRKESLII